MVKVASEEKGEGMTTVEPAQQILDSALALAEARSWEAVRLLDVAAATGMTLDAMRGYFREKEDLVEAWFDRADRALLQRASEPDFLGLSARERLYCLLLAWLDALAPHRRVTRQMLLGKCELGHFHVQLAGMLRISRTVQWLREAAHQEATSWHRALEETTLTGIYLLTFSHWLNDDSPNAIRTRRRLEALLRVAEMGANGLAGFLRFLSPRTAPPSYLR